MKHAKLAEIINRLNEADFRKLGDFIKSPYHNKNKHLIDFYAYFLKGRDKKKLLIIDDNDIFKFLYPGQRYSSKKIDSLFLKIKPILEEFFICEELQKEKLHSSYQPLNLYRLNHIDV